MGLKGKSVFSKDLVKIIERKAAVKLPLNCMEW